MTEFKSIAELEKEIGEILNGKCNDVTLYRKQIREAKLTQTKAIIEIIKKFNMMERISAEHRKHEGNRLDWSRIAECKLKSELISKLESGK